MVLEILYSFYFNIGHGLFVAFMALFLYIYYEVRKELAQGTHLHTLQLILSLKMSGPFLLDLLPHCHRPWRHNHQDTYNDYIFKYYDTILHNIFLVARVCWQLRCLCRPFCIFERCLNSNTESCLSKQALYQLSHPSP
jgi:hypothetical protein